MNKFPLFGCIIILLLTGCKREPVKPSHIAASTDTVSIAPVNPVVNVYIENSGSMDGYVTGNTEFKGAIRDLLVLLKHYYSDSEKIKVHFINSQIRETDTKADLATFAQNINAQWSVKGEDRSSSNLNNVFKQILEKTDKETISILFSDCIYSIKGKDAEGLLSDEKSLTKDAFLSRWRVDSLGLATTIVKMTSKFSGKYYDKNNAITVLTGQKRPYYICIVASKDVIDDFNSKIPLERGKIEGFDNKYIMSSGATDNLYYSILLSSYSEGRFKPQRSHTSDYIHGIEHIKPGRDGKPFTFGVAVNMKQVAAEEDYLLSPENYILSDNNFIVKEIVKAEKNQIRSSDWVKISKGNPTHVIVLEATGTALADMTIALKKQTPQWIEQTNIIDDSNILKNLDKTFGIKYLIDGIAEAYETLYPDDKNYFELKIKINK
ncbi:MAG: hypothetical protein LBR34_11080 [Prevotella sp.]|jgi:hypothetical protein|nr:hypothetical protein [Prevotella sp.]